MASKRHDRAQLNELLYQALETESGGIEIYQMALECAVNDDLREEWQGYLGETRRHHQILTAVLTEMGLDPQAGSPGRDVVAHIGASLVKAMRMAQQAGDPQAAELVAAECVVLAETKDHQNWELIGHVAKNISGKHAQTLMDAYDQVEKEEDHHLYHTKGWGRELWIASLGFKAVLPPPEEVKHVETAIGASRAEQTREQMLKKN